MRKLAAIDIGTNSMRLMLCEEQNGSLQKKSKELIVTRIGEGLSENGSLSEKAIARNIEALCLFADKIRSFGADDSIAIATSAVRDAANGASFIIHAKHVSGMNIRMINGKEEAELGLSGVAMDLEDSEEKVLVIDIGGGSTELILGTKKSGAYNVNTDYAVSVNAGAVRMTEQYVRNHPILRADMEKMQERLKELFLEALNRLKRERIDKVIGIGGTATTAAAIFHKMAVYDSEKVHKTVLKQDVIWEMLYKLKEMALSERYLVLGLQRERADVIPSGLCILNYLLKELKVESLIVSESDNLEGAIYKYLM
jgi:exopolyphosphatase/guanosine-5'-triphosphate,3'-diphosphate pyrophosphatase